MRLALDASAVIYAIEGAARARFHVVERIEEIKTMAATSSPPASSASRCV